MKSFLAVCIALFCCRMVAQEVPATPPVQFLAVDIYVDSQDKPLAAYQLEFSVEDGSARVVGIEGGEPSAFRAPPYYDPKAIQHERVIIAAFSTNSVNELPRGKVRVATVHLQVSQGMEPKVSLKLHVAADASGNKLPAEASAERKSK